MHTYICITYMCTHTYTDIYMILFVHLFVSFHLPVYYEHSLPLPTFPGPAALWVLSPSTQAGFPGSGRLGLAIAAHTECHRVGHRLSQRSGEFQITECRAMPWPVSSSQENRTGEQEVGQG